MKTFCMEAITQPINEGRR